MTPGVQLVGHAFTSGRRAQLSKGRAGLSLLREPQGPHVDGVQPHSGQGHGRSRLCERSASPEHSHPGSRTGVPRGATTFPAVSCPPGQRPSLPRPPRTEGLPAKDPALGCIQPAPAAPSSSPQTD